MSVIAEAMTRLKLEAFEQNESYRLNEGFINIEETEHTIAAVASHTFSDTTAEDCENFNCAQESYSCKSSLSLLKQHFDEFRTSNCGNANENFLFWNSYLIDIFHILQDHELSLKKR